MGHSGKQRSVHSDRAGRGPQPHTPNLSSHGLTGPLSNITYTPVSPHAKSRCHVFIGHTVCVCEYGRLYVFICLDCKYAYACECIWYEF